MRIVPANTKPLFCRITYSHAQDSHPVGGSSLVPRLLSTKNRKGKESGNETRLGPQTHALHQQ